MGKLIPGALHSATFLGIVATSFLKKQNTNQSKYPSTDEWINKTWYIHTVEYYSALKGQKFWHMLEHE